MLENMTRNVIFPGAVLVWLGGGLASLTLAAAPPLAAEANGVVEVPLVSETTYANPFKEITLDALVSAPDGRQFKVPAFWAGGNEWRFRYSSGLAGTHTYRTECSDPKNPKLHGVEGKIEVVSYRGESPLYRHGPIGSAKDQRHFEHADGTPFFWLGDTWWKGLCQRISWEGFQQLTADRKAKGLHRRANHRWRTLSRTKPLFDPRWKNEGGMPYEKDFERLNPAYFDYADRRLGHLMDNGHGSRHRGRMGMAHEAVSTRPSEEGKMVDRHWRYLIARYGAYPVIWIVAGEMRQP